MFRILTTIVLLTLIAGTSAWAKPETYEVDPVHSMAIFEIEHLGIGRIFGRFNDISGTVVMDKVNVSASSVSMSIDPASIDTNNEDRDKHLRSPDFFNVKQFPKWTFESTSVRPGKDGSAIVTGDLTAHGRTIEISFDIRQVGEGNDPWGNYRSGWTGEFTISRSQLGIDYMKDGLSDEVVFTIAVEGIRK